MAWKQKRTPKGFSQYGYASKTRFYGVVARNKKGEKFAVIKLNGRMAPRFATKVSDEFKRFAQRQ